MVPEWQESLAYFDAALSTTSNKTPLPKNGGWRLRAPINATTVLIPGETGTGKDLIAAILGLHPSTLRARMHKLGIIRPETKEPY